MFLSVQPTESCSICSQVYWVWFSVFSFPQGIFQLASRHVFNGGGRGGRKGGGDTAGGNVSQRTYQWVYVQPRREGLQRGTEGSELPLLCQQGRWKHRWHINQSEGNQKLSESDFLLDFRGQTQRYLIRLEFETEAMKNFHTDKNNESCSEICQTGKRRMCSIRSRCRNLNLRDP